LREVDRRHAGRGALRQEDALSGTDALLTATPDLPLAISTADCVPVVISGRGEEAGALLATVHAGWRGMLGGIVARAVAMMRQRGAARAAVVGPSIGPCCFTVDDALERRFEARFPGSGRGGAVDLWHCARLELAAAGLPPDAIVAAGVCTSCDRRFFSHRRDQGSTGRHLALAWLEPA
jgi:YfiH family protein